jgi:exosortase A-associated hydrolase 1
MGETMRRVVTVDCMGATLFGTVDEAPGKTGLLIVSGGNEIRIGAHRGMAKLAADVATAGYPVFRFDRRGIGDSEGANGGFRSSQLDITAAVAGFRSQCPALARIVAFGNCDAASALLLHHVSGIDSLVLANPWVLESSDEMPPPAAIKARYAERIVDPDAWWALFSGAINLKNLARGLLRIVKPQATSRLAKAVANGFVAFTGSIDVVLATRDGTAIVFAAEWQKADFAKARAKPTIRIAQIDSASHSFAGEADYSALRSHILKTLGP